MGKKDYPKEHTETVLDEYVIGRLNSHGQHFEILLKPDAVEKYRGNKPIDLVENMPVDKVFVDAKKGKEAPQDEVEKVFDTHDIEKIAERILKEGEVQMTTEQRRKRKEQKRKDIINRIVRDSMNPQTGTPHPPQRIENAMKEANIHIDPFKPVSKQVDEVVDEIKKLLPLSFKRLTIKITVRGDYYGKIYGDLKDLGTIADDKWLNDGRWQGKIKIPAGAKDELFERINNKTKGDADIQTLDE
ncbi:MAG: ribosome assembly factor SBDS [Thermoplasmatota archaeon]